MPNPGEVLPSDESQQWILCRKSGRDPISGKFCILRDGHEGQYCKVDTPLLDSDQWDEPQWQDYEQTFGRHVTPSE